MANRQRARFRTAIQILAPTSLRSAVQEAAARELTTVSEYTRRALVARLRQDGVQVGGAEQQR
jgi:hypothetical protein